MNFEHMVKGASAFLDINDEITLKPYKPKELRLSMVGESGVGKTSLRNKYMRD